MSESPFRLILLGLMFPRVKENLRSGEYMVPGDQWPMLLYKNYIYDPEDPWKGLLRSAILVNVSQ